MTDKQYQALADIVGLIMASTLITVALIHLVPNGMWLHLIYLGMGIVIITNKVNRVLRGN
jgi:hypothetical protein